jgi:hypothetical protein
LDGIGMPTSRQNYAPVSPLLSACHVPADCRQCWTLNGFSERHRRFHGIAE